MEDKLIEAVQMFPCLYDKSKKEYKNKLYKEKTWASVATATGTTVKHCQSRWKSLRDRYVRQVISTKARSGAAAEEKVKWRYMDAMAFLQNHVAPRNTFSNMQWGTSEQEPCTEMETAQCDNNTWSDDVSSFEDSIVFEETNSTETTEIHKMKTAKKRQKIQEAAHEKFNKLCGAVSELITSKKEKSEKSRNEDFLKVLDSYLLKHLEEKQDKLKIQVLNLVYPTN